MHLSIRSTMDRKGMQGNREGAKEERASLILRGRTVSSLLKREEMPKRVTAVVTYSACAAAKYVTTPNSQ